MTIQILGITAADSLVACIADHTTSVSNQRKKESTALLKSIETGDSKPIDYINPDKYIQHNLSAADGLAGFGALLQIQKKRLKILTKSLIFNCLYVFACSCFVRLLADTELQTN